MKYFGIGLMKTGLTSLYRAMSFLNKRSFQFLPHERYSEYNVITSRCDFCVDMPWTYRYKELAEQFPNSKFILTYRKNPYKWLASAHNFVNYVRKASYTQPIQINFFGYDTTDIAGNEAEFIKKYYQHQDEVYSFFLDKPERLLVLALEDHETHWRHLCKFVGMSEVVRPWPHEKKSEYNKEDEYLNSLLRKAKDISGC